jgi:hypothetical protein
MAQQMDISLTGTDPGGGPAAREPRSERAEFCFPESMKLGIKEIAARFDVSGNEVVLHCLEYGLSNSLVLQLIEDAAATRRALGPDAETPDGVRSEHKLTPSLKRRLEETAAWNDTDTKEIARRCVQHGLLDQRLHRLILAAAVSRNGKKLGRTLGRTRGRTVRKEEVTHRAA